MEEEKGEKLKICNDAKCICFRANCKSVWTVWGGNTAAGKEKYRTKARMSSALFTARGASETLSQTLKML